MDNRQAIINKIAAMTALKENSGAFQGEIENAAAMVQKLMEKYSISWAEIHQHEASRQAAEYARQFSSQRSEFAIGFVKKWHWDLAKIIAEITHTKYFMRGSRTMFFFGVDENAAIASSLYAQWVVTIDLAAKDALKKYRSWLVSKFYTGQKNFYTQLPPEYQTKYFRESWISGCISALHANVRRMASQSSALVLYDAEVTKKFQEAFPKIKKVRVSEMSDFSRAGYEKGAEFGASINLAAKPLKKG